MGTRISVDRTASGALQSLFLATLFATINATAATVIEVAGEFGSPAFESSGIWDETNATFVPGTFFGRPGLVEFEVTPNSDASLRFRFSLEGPDGQFPGPGTYPVQRFPFQDAGFAGGNVTGFIGCNQGTGTVDVHEIEYSPDGTVARIAADLRYACTNTDLFTVAKVRINSTIPLEPPGPHAVVAAEQVTTPGATVTLDGSGSFADNAAIATYRWRQIEGERVEIRDPTASVATFDFPSDLGRFQQMLFELTVTDTLGRTDTARTSVITGATLTPDVVRVVERGNNFVWTEEFSGLGTAPVDPYEVEGGPTAGLFVDASGTLIEVSPPATRDLRAGGYTGAQRNGSISMLPGLWLRGCNYEPSDGTSYEAYFDILDLSLGSLGSVDRAGFDFFVRCSSVNRNTFEGIVRVGSFAPEQIEHPRALAGNDQLAFAGEPGFANGLSSRIPDNTQTAFSWTQVAGPTVTIEEPTSAITRVVPSAAIANSEVVALQLDISDDSGRQSSDVVEMTVVPTVAPRTSLYVDSDETTFIGGGETVYIRDGQDTSIQALVQVLSTGAQRDEVALLDENPSGWNVRVIGSVPDGLFVPGYRSATFSADPSDALPSLSLGRSGRGCSRASGEIHVIDLARDASLTLTSIAIDFSLTCDGEVGSLRGELRFNSTVPHSFEVLSVDAGDDQVVSEGSTVELVDSSASDIRTRWEQVSGPQLFLSDATSKQTTFVPPTIPAGESRRFAFRLINQRDDGAWGEDYTVVSVNDNGRATWDGIAFEKYIDIPQSYLVDGVEFGFRTVNDLGNLARVEFDVEQVDGIRIGDEAVVSTVFPVTEAVYRGVAAALRAEYFSETAIPADYALITKDVDGVWRRVGTTATGDGLFLENGVSRLHVTISPDGSSGNGNDLDSLDQSLTFRFAVVRLGDPPPPPAPGGGSSSGGGALGAGSILVLGVVWILTMRRRRRALRLDG
ncbi:MAG: hypothetical protein AAGH76_17515 [Pseudomonadota bacterium]